jgi:hypothetical protein
MNSPLTRILALTLTLAGCASPYYADKGAGLGALGGAGVGALVGHAVGDTGAGALIGAGVGALGGAAVGSSLDNIQAQNRAEIAAQMGRQVQPGAATVEEVVAMSRSGVSPMLISNYVRTSGMARPVTASDVIALHNSGVPDVVIQSMQTPAVPAGAPGAVPLVAAGPAPTPVIVEQVYYPAPICGTHYDYHHHHHHRRGLSWGVSVSH